MSFAFSLFGQVERVKNQPYADLKRYHLGFHIGFHFQDMILNNTGVTTGGQTWFAEIPSYSPGFSVGVIGDMYLSQYFNIRVIPTIDFGDKKVTFIEQASGDTQDAVVRSNYLTLPVQLKYSALRLNNVRPYIAAGVYGALDLGRKKGNELLLKPYDYGVELSLGCTIYFTFFRLSPELKFRFGLTDILEHDRVDLDVPDMLKYTQALSKATSRMITLTFNFE